MNTDLTDPNGRKVNVKEDAVGRCTRCNGDISEYTDGSTLCVWCEREDTVGKHTPGPWRVTGHHFIIVEAADGTTVSTPIYYLRTLDEHKANARLIAAAPELLEALEGFMSYHNDIITSGKTYTKANRQLGLEMVRSGARAAIAKATE